METRTDASTFNQQPIKRKRLSLACNVCRRRKIKCDGVKPTCGKCERFHQTCSYADVVRKRGPKQGHIELLEQRLKKMEEMISGGSSVLEASNSSLPIVQQPLTGATPLEKTKITNPPLINSTSSSIPSAQPVLPTAPPSTYSTIDNMIPLPKHYDHLSWPSPDIVDHLVDIYFAHFETLSPIADYKSLRASIADKTCDTFLLFAILSVAARLSNRPDIIETPLWMSGEKYASKARAMIATVIEQPTIEHTQGLLILVYNEYGCARGPTCWMYVGIAIRMIFEIGLDKEIMLRDEEQDDVLSIERWFYYENRRRLFWNTYLQDVLGSSSTGRPQMMDITNSDVLLPVHNSSLSLQHGEFYQRSLDGRCLIRYTVVDDGNGVQMTSVDLSDPRNRCLLNQVGLEARLIECYTLMADVSRFVNRKHKKFVNDSVYNNEFLQLDAKLDAWIERLPLYLRNTPANLEFYRNQKNSFDAGQFVLTHILHNGLIVLLNRPSLELINTPKLGQFTQEVQDMIHRSVEKCLAAADNVTVMLKDSKNKLNVVPPSVIYFAYTAAIVMVNGMFSTNPNESKKAELALGEFYKFFEDMKHYWAMSDKFYFLVRDLYAMHLKLADACEASSPTTTRSSRSENSYTSWQSSTRLPPLADMAVNTGPSDYHRPQKGKQEPIDQSLNSTNSFAMPSFDYWLQQQQEQRK